MQVTCAVTWILTDIVFWVIWTLRQTCQEIQRETLTSGLETQTRTSVFCEVTGIWIPTLRETFPWGF